MLHPVAENCQEDMHNNSSNEIISIPSQVPLVDPKNIHGTTAFSFERSLQIHRVNAPLLTPCYNLSVH